MALEFPERQMARAPVASDPRACADGDVARRTDLRSSFTVEYRWERHGAFVVLPLFLSLAGIALLSVSGYLGGRLVHDEGIAVGRHKRRTSMPSCTLRFSATESGFVPVPEGEGLRERETLRIEIDGEVIAIARIDNLLFAFQEFCTHRFGPLSEGCLDACYVECPWHNSRFDVRTGKVVQGPAKVDLKTFNVEIRSDRVGILLDKGP